PITVRIAYSDRRCGAWRRLVSLVHFFNLLSGGHSSLEPRLPIPNRTVKRVCADDSVPFAHAKVGYRQAIFKRKSPGSKEHRAFLLIEPRRRTICPGRIRA